MHCQGNEFKITVNCELHTELFSQLFYSSSIAFCFENSLDKAPTLLLIFICFTSFPVAWCFVQVAQHVTVVVSRLVMFRVVSSHILKYIIQTAADAVVEVNIARNKPQCTCEQPHVAKGHAPFNSRCDTIDSGPKGLLG